MKIGISSCIFHQDLHRPVFNGKPLLYVVEELAHWVMSQGALAFMIPTPNSKSIIGLKELISELDGIILQGGADVCPKNYGEEPIKPEWSGDALRDHYEIELINQCIKMKKPIFRICRGLQIINVALGGTLYQDIQTQIPGTILHRDAAIYDQNFHHIVIKSGTYLSTLYKGTNIGKINSVHHQAIKELGKNITVEARSKEDGVIEAIRYTSESYVFGIQWHPEFHDPNDPSLLDGRVILRDFLEKCLRS